MAKKKTKTATTNNLENQLKILDKSLDKDD